ncbi:hypothetical protein NN3_13190 [Nocardia neocaledoniensis NBRC 108232]|nr:hypothetical protein NN3_13190 [Nocardia neocaledoniensis NBRC 108232]
MIKHIGAKLLGNHDDPTCTQAFPYGLASPIGINTYHPADVAEMTTAPLVVLIPGYAADPGMYDALARHWASHGFIVTIPYDYFNSMPHVAAAGLAMAIVADRDPSSPLFGKVDLDHTILAGHSAGGQAALQGAALLPPIARAIDPTLTIRGVLAIEPGPLALGSLLTVPSLFLTGSNDFVVPDFAWVRWWQYNLTSRAPAWIANARATSHASPIDGIEHFAAAPTATAWLAYLAYDDAAARHRFLGADWTLRHDPAFLTAERNALADQLN